MGGGAACCVCLPDGGPATVPTLGHGPGTFSFMIIVLNLNVALFSLTLLVRGGADSAPPYEISL